jgi:mRNA interferase MazF
VLVVQADDFNRSRIATVIVVVLTSNEKLAQAPGNVLLSRKITGLPQDSVANVSQVLTIDKSLLTERIGVLSSKWIGQVEAGLRLVMKL